MIFIWFSIHPIIDIDLVDRWWLFIHWHDWLLLYSVISDDWEAHLFSIDIGIVDQSVPYHCWWSVILDIVDVIQSLLTGIHCYCCCCRYCDYSISDLFQSHSVDHYHLFKTALLLLMLCNLLFDVVVGVVTIVVPLLFICYWLHLTLTMLLLTVSFDDYSVIENSYWWWPPSSIQSDRYSTWLIRAIDPSRYRWSRWCDAGRLLTLTPDIVIVKCIVGPIDLIRDRYWPQKLLFDIRPDDDVHCWRWLVMPGGTPADPVTYLLIPIPVMLLMLIPIGDDGIIVVVHWYWYCYSIVIIQYWPGIVGIVGIEIFPPPLLLLLLLLVNIIIIVVIVDDVIYWLLMVLYVNPSQWPCPLTSTLVLLFIVEIIVGIDDIVIVIIRYCNQYSVLILTVIVIVYCYWYYWYCWYSLTVLLILIMMMMLVLLLRWLIPVAPEFIRCWWSGCCWHSVVIRWYWYWRCWPHIHLFVDHYCCWWYSRPVVISDILTPIGIIVVLKWCLLMAIVVDIVIDWWQWLRRIVSVIIVIVNIDC